MENMKVVVSEVTGNWYIRKGHQYFSGFNENFQQRWGTIDESKPYGSIEEATAQMNLLEDGENK